MALAMASDRKEENIGQPVQIIDILMNRNKPSKMSVNTTNLRFILNNVGDHNIALISVAGPSRLGKSFLLSFMVRYLGALEKEESADWIGSVDRGKALVGFPFQNGIERMTTGIWLWSRPFFIKNAIGEEIAVLLMDTQGVFDDHTTMKEWSAIVGISLLTSSCLIYNVVNNLQEDALAILETFMQFGILAMENSESADSCFQKLVFLIRDWNMPDDCEYGPLGGQKFLTHKLQIQQHLPPESIRVRQTLRKCFEEIDCFLMPDPGEEAKSNDFRGSLAELDEKFVKNLLTFMDSLISPEQISVKKVDGQPIKGKDLLTYFQRYVTLFNSSGIPSPTNMLDATAYASCDVLVSKCLSSVNKQFSEILERKGFVSSQEWEPLFNPFKIEAMKMYDAKRKFGDPKIAAQQRRRLEGELLKLLNDIKGKNEELINQKVAEEQLKLIDTFSLRISNILDMEFLMKEELETIIFQETETIIKNFCSAFSQCNEVLEGNIPVLTQKIKEVANQFRTGNDKKIGKAAQILKAALEQSFRKYKDDMDLRLLSTGEGTISDDFLLKLDATFRDRALSHFQTLPKEGPEGFITKFRTELEMKINEKFEGYAAENSKKRVMQKGKTEKLIDEITKLYLEEMSNILSREAAPDSLFLEQRHFQLQQKYSDMFMSRCEIQDVSSLIPFRQMLNVSLQDALEMAKHQLFERQNEVRNNILMGIERHVENHHKNISDLLNERQICTEQHLRNTHENITKSCQSDLNFPSFLTSEERKDYSNILLSHLKQDFELLLSSYENKFQEANGIAENIIANIIDQYYKVMDGKANDIFDKSQLDEYHSKEKNKWGNELMQKVKFFPPEILNQYQKKLDAQLDDAYEIIVDHFEANLSEMNQRVMSIYYDTISQYSIQMETKSKANNDREALSGWHDLFKEKAVIAFEKDVRNLKMNCDPQRKKLQRQLSEEFQSILMVKNADEQEIKNKADNHLHDALAKFNRDASNLLEDKSLQADTFSKKLNEIKTAAGQYFYENSSGISREIMSGKKRDLEEQIEKCYNKINDDFLRQKEEETLFIDTTVVKSVSYYQSKMDGLFQDSELLEMEKFVDFHKKSVKEAMQKIPGDSVDSVSQIVQQKIDFLYEKYKRDQMKHLEEAANEVKKMMDDLKNDMTNAISQKSKAAQDTKELHDLKKKLEANAYEMLKSFKVPGNKSKQSLIDEMEKHLQNTIVKAENEIKSREPDSTVLNVVKDSAIRIYGEEMEKHFSVTPFMAPRILDNHHNIACKKAMHKAGTMIPLTPKVTIDLDVMFKGAFTKFQNKNRMNTPKNPAIGIDLGTTFSCVAVYNQGLKMVKIIPNENTKNTTPSYVAFTKDGTELVGDPAKNQAHGNPENTIFDAKRLIGRRFHEDVVQRDIKLWPFKVIDDNGSPKIQVNDKTYFPEEISAKILTKMKDIAETHLNCKVENAVITVPAYFNDGQKQATIHAGQVAGLNVLGILSEPTAAAIAYSLNETFNKSRNVLIFDFGGGTFDVAVLSIHNGKINVKGVDGDTHLGGEDFDSNMVDYCVEQFKNTESVDLVADRESENIILRGDCNRRIRRLRNECEKQKINLSGSTTATVAIDCLHEKSDIHVEITRDTFETINKNLFDKAIDIVKRALESANLKKEEIDDIVLVGGSTRVPKIQQLLINFFDGRALSRSINPDEAVAIGAAVQAAILNGCTAEELAGFELTDVTPLSIGIEIVGGIHSVIIEKNTQIPVKKEQNYTTTRDDQTSVNIQIYEGEEKKTKDNHLLGDFVLDGIPKGKKGSADIIVSMDIDANGILTVNAACKGSNTSKNLSIQQNKGRLTDEDIKKLSNKTAHGLP